MSAKFLVEVVVESPPVITPVKAYGWGNDAVAVQLSGGRPMQIMIRRNDKSQIAIQIQEDGRLTITDHGGMNFSHYVSSQPFNLYPSRPWEIK